MRDYRTLCLLAFTCSGMLLMSGEQRKPAPQQRPPIQERANPDQNKQVARRVFDDLFTRGRYEAIGQVYDPNCRVHFGSRQIGLQEAVAEGKGWRSAAPDLVMTAEQMSVDGDKVIVVWSARGTHTGQGHGIKPTGKRFAMKGRSEFLVRNGRIVEAFNEEYRPELFRQLGVSKTQAFLFFAGEKLLAMADPIIPNRFYAALQ